VSAPASVVTIGNLDGVHLGHRELVGRAVELARVEGLRSVALTFDPHPAALLRPDGAPPLLQPLAERVAALSALGIDHVEVLAFDRELAALSPEAFVAEVLVERLGARRVVVGDNFRFGHGASGDVEALARVGGPLGLAVDRVALVTGDGAAVSSTEVRRAVADGEVERAAALLGRPFTLTGEVVAGDGRGRGIGVPTANVALTPGLVLPADGVYAGHARVEGEAGPGAPCVTNVGWRPTFDGRTRTVEAHLLDTDRDLYGQRLTVAFEHRLRGEERFASPEELVARIRGDVEAARALLTRGA
jgi:riboflavin kinase/FMN adenylyltransferase